MPATTSVNLGGGRLSFDWSINDDFDDAPGRRGFDEMIIAPSSAIEFAALRHMRPPPSEYFLGPFPGRRFGER